jgi:hypothetical protein
MFGRVASAFLVLLLLFPQASAKNKKKQALPEYVLKAQTVAVVIRPDAGEPVTNPTANRTAQASVEDAITQWGRFKVITDPQAADLIIAIRKGHENGTTIRNSPLDNRPEWRYSRRFSAWSFARSHRSRSWCSGPTTAPE